MKKIKVNFNGWNPPVRLLDVQAFATKEIPEMWQIDHRAEIPKGNRTVLICTLMDANLWVYQQVLSYGSVRKVELQRLVGHQVELEYTGAMPEEKNPQLDAFNQAKDQGAE